MQTNKIQQFLIQNLVTNAASLQHPFRRKFERFLEQKNSYNGKQLFHLNEF